MFKLKRPCVNCPFRKGQGRNFSLSWLRLREIKTATAFQCHKTVDYDNFDDAELRSGGKPQQCAGLMAVLHRSGISNQIMQVAERLGRFNPNELDPDNEAYKNWDCVLKAHSARK